MTIRYRKKPVEVDARRWTGDNEAEMLKLINRTREVSKFCLIAPGSRYDDSDHTAEVYDEAHAMWIPLATGDWVVRGEGGQLVVCEDVAFWAGHDAIEVEP